MKILVVGARGSVGRRVCELLEARGETVRRFARGEVIATAAEGAGAIIDCAGASMALGLGHGWRGYRAIDTPIGLACVAAARATGARLVYVGVHHPAAMRGGAYIDAHERVATALRDIDGVIVRATGFFSAFAAFLPLARRGILLDVGNGRARTNPIAEHDLAEVIVGAIGDGSRELSAGGPEVMTRAEILDIVAARVNRRVRIVRAPRWLAVAGGALLRLVHPRIGQLTRFAAGLAIHDVIAPAVGTTTLRDYLARVG